MSVLEFGASVVRGSPRRGPARDLGQYLQSVGTPVPLCTNFPSLPLALKRPQLCRDREVLDQCLCRGCLTFSSPQKGLSALVPRGEPSTDLLGTQGQWGADSSSCYPEPSRRRWEAAGCSPCPRTDNLPMSSSKWFPEPDNIVLLGVCGPQNRPPGPPGLSITESVRPVHPGSAGPHGKQVRVCVYVPLSLSVPLPPAPGQLVHIPCTGCVAAGQARAPFSSVTAAVIVERIQCLAWGRHLKNRRHYYDYYSQHLICLKCLLVGNR